MKVKKLLIFSVALMLLPLAQAQQFSEEIDISKIIIPENVVIPESEIEFIHTLWKCLLLAPFPTGVIFFSKAILKSVKELSLCPIRSAINFLYSLLKDAQEISNLLPILVFLFFFLCPSGIFDIWQIALWMIM